MGFLASAVLFAVGYFPTVATFSLDVIDEVEAVRKRLIDRRRHVAMAGFAVFSVSLIAASVATVLALRVK